MKRHSKDGQRRTPPLDPRHVGEMGVIGLIALLTSGIMLGASWLFLIAISIIFLGVVWLYWRRRQKLADKASRQDSLEAVEVFKLSAGLIDIMPQPIAIIDQTYKIHHANAAAVDLIKIERFGVPLSNYVSHPDINKRLSRGLAGYVPAPLMLHIEACLLYTSPSPRDRQKSRMPSSA